MNVFAVEVNAGSAAGSDKNKNPAADHGSGVLEILRIRSNPDSRAAAKQREKRKSKVQGPIHLRAKKHAAAGAVNGILPRSGVGSSVPSGAL
jgi:hypothetical protein